MRRSMDGVRETVSSRLSQLFPESSRTTLCMVSDGCRVYEMDFMSPVGWEEAVAATCDLSFRGARYTDIVQMLKSYGCFPIYFADSVHKSRSSIRKAGIEGGRMCVARRDGSEVWEGRSEVRQCPCTCRFRFPLCILPCHCLPLPATTEIRPSAGGAGAEEGRAGGQIVGRGTIGSGGRGSCQIQTPHRRRAEK